MKNAILLHGMPSREEYYNPDLPSASNNHWLPWLQKQLLTRDIATVTPEVPLAFEPNWPTWVHEVERYDITPESILVGHSAGAAFWLKYLSEHKELRVGKVILVAPGLGWDERDFFNCNLDPDLAARADGITLFYSDNDYPQIAAAVERIDREVKGVKLRLFPGYGHFTSRRMKTNEFPELLKEILA